jgi:sugar-specific transcriptional regulator TrmB
MKATFDNKGPSIVANVPQYREGCIQILRRGGTIQCITEVTKDNINQCKELLGLVTELRHMDGMKAGITVNETEYMATSHIQEGEPLTEIYYSNTEEIVSQGHYIFDTMWRNSIPALQKIREIEEGRSPDSNTKILSRSDGSLDESHLGTLFDKATEVCIVGSTEGLSIGYAFFYDLLKKKQTAMGFNPQKYFKLLVEVSKDNLAIVKKYTDLDIEVRHLKKEPPIYFAVTDSDLMATIERMQHNDVTESILFSNDLLYIHRFRSMFERMWNDSRSALEVMNLLENNEEIPFLETIENSEKTFNVIKEMISNADDEILGMLPSLDSLHRQVNAGMFDHIRRV